MEAQRLVACVGDSITQGQVSANYVRILEQRPASKGVRFVNAGVNGNLAYNVAQRLDAVIAQRPDVVTLLIGTNDVNAHFDDAWRARYRKDQKLPVDPSQDWYGEQVDQILRRLSDNTDARIAVLTIPPLGEDLDSRMNRLVNDYNTTLVGLASTHGATVLPLHDRLVALIPSDRTAVPYEGNVRKVATAAAQHLLLRRSWNTVSRRNGLTVLTDHIHLNDTAANAVADLIDAFLQEDPA
jgi:acyl-CoA thioesterase I